MGYPELKLIQDFCTRWNSTYDMFQRCINNKELLMSTISVGLAHPATRGSPSAPGHFYILGAHIEIYICIYIKGEKILSLLAILDSSFNRIYL